VRTFLCELIPRLRQDGIAFHTLSEVYQAHKSALANPDAGRTERVSSAQYHAYRQGDEAAKQSALRDLYGGRNAADRYATSRDYNLRELEISAIANELKQETPGRLIDFGCGNGYTLISLAHALKGWKFEGIDFTPSLIEGAHLLAAETTFTDNAPQFFCADAIAHIRDMGAASIDATLTERFIVNLPSRQAQHDFISQIARVLRPGGLFLMCEGSREGHHALNRLRQACGLEAIPENSEDNLSSLRFNDVEIENFLKLAGFDLLAKRGFSSYFAMSRALHPAFVAPQQPRFKSRINDLARSIQEGLPFTPGLGSNVLWALRKT
jgi:SAM-dependent methyltransferase